MRGDKWIFPRAILGTRAIISFAGKGRLVDLGAVMGGVE
jgi:hypothetical protein